MMGNTSKFCSCTVFELCRCTQQPSLTFPLIGGSTFGLWLLFHLREGGNGHKWLPHSMGKLKDINFFTTTLTKIMIVFFHEVFKKNHNCYFYLCYFVTDTDLRRAGLTGLGSGRKCRERYKATNLSFSRNNKNTHFKPIPNSRRSLFPNICDTCTILNSLFCGI
jgi:hypothetical protein